MGEAGDMDFIPRNEEEKDYRAVEEITREAFWNLYCPGCNALLDELFSVRFCSKCGLKFYDASPGKPD